MTSGAASGYRPTATQPIGVEIRRQLSRRRTVLTLALLVLLPIGLAAAFAWGSGGASGTGFYAHATASAANFTVFTLAVSQTFLLIVIVALYFGDMIASEASWGSLRYLLTIPIPRARLLGVKVVVATLSMLCALLVLTVTALVVGAATFGWEPMRSPTGAEFGANEAVLRIGLTVGYLAVTLLVVAGLAQWLSVSTNAPLAAVGGAVLFMVLSGIVDQVTALGRVRSLLPTHYFDGWHGLFADPMRFDAMSKGAIVALVYAGLFAAAAWWTFHRKDILS